MRKVPWLLLACLVVLAGCNGFAGDETTPETETNATVPPAPATDTIGWENGYWHNETIAVTNEDGLNASEREAVVARSMARIESIRDSEFNESVPVEVITREQFRDEQDREFTDSVRTFDNTQSEAMFFVGEDRDSIAVQQSNLGASVLGYYDPKNDTIKLVAESGQPTLDGEAVLAHELVHALQDQRHNLSDRQARTRDARAGATGLIEGEANAIQFRYEDRCDAEWNCLERDSGQPSVPDIHWGFYLVEFFPYSDGPGLVEHLHDRGGWDAVDAAFEEPPASAEQVIYPDRYTAPRDEPVDVSLPGTATNGWERVRPNSSQVDGDHPGYATLGQSVLTSMFAYTAFDESNPALLSRREIATGDRRDPLDYDLDVTEGWEGDRLQVYRNPATGDNETAYVWRIEWESAQDASEFADGYRELLGYWGGQPTGQANTWHIPEDEPFGDAFRLDVDGSTVTIVNAPTVDALADVHEE